MHHPARIDSSLQPDRDANSCTDDSTRIVCNAHADADTLADSCGCTDRGASSPRITHTHSGATATCRLLRLTYPNPLLKPGASPVLNAWTPQPYAGPALSLPIDLSQLANPHVLDGLTAAQKTFLAENGFVVLHSQEAQFDDIRVETASRTGQPYFLTTDAAFHALHLNFDELLKALERQQLRRR